jgi:hypothetical protein
MVNQRRGEAPPTDGTSKLANAEPERDDGREGTWTRQQRIDMDLKFRAKLERALKRGCERPQDRK